MTAPWIKEGKMTADENKAYCQGAISAYRDIAQMVQNLANTLPEEVDHFLPVFEMLVASCNRKVEIMQQGGPGLAQRH